MVENQAAANGCGGEWVTQGGEKRSDDTHGGKESH